MPAAPKFTIQLNHLFTPKVRYVAESGSVRVFMDNRLHRMSTPTNQQWAGFRRLCAFLEIEHWLADYGDEAARDGLPWSLEFDSGDGNKVSSKGISAFPSLEDSTIAGGYMDRLGLLLHFIDFTLLNSRIDSRDIYG